MLKTFSLGGIHPADRKISADKSIEVLPLPKRVVVPVAQHIGAPAKTELKKGDQVKAGQVIAKSSGFVSANIHSPVSGKVFKLDEAVDASGYRKPVVIIDVEGDEWAEGIDTSDKLVENFEADSKKIIDKINAAGIVGLGGATFPTHVKLMPPQGMTAEMLLINGVECEPYLTSDHRVMLEKAPELLVGIRLLMCALEVKKAYIGIENNKPDAIKHLKTLTKNEQGIEIQPLKVQYPQGGEKQLIKAVTGREVP